MTDLLRFVTPGACTRHSCRARAPQDGKAVRCAGRLNRTPATPGRRAVRRRASPAARSRGGSEARLQRRDPTRTLTRFAARPLSRKAQPAAGCRIRARRPGALACLLSSSADDKWQPCRSTAHLLHTRRCRAPLRRVFPPASARGTGSLCESRRCLRLREARSKPVGMWPLVCAFRGDRACGGLQRERIFPARRGFSAPRL